jgi:hypothetical protein
VAAVPIASQTKKKPSVYEHLHASTRGLVILFYFMHFLQHGYSYILIKLWFWWKNALNSGSNKYKAIISACTNHHNVFVLNFILSSRVWIYIRKLLHHKIFSIYDIHQISENWIHIWNRKLKIWESNNEISGNCTNSWRTVFSKHVVIFNKIFSQYWICVPAY